VDGDSPGHFARRRACARLGGPDLEPFRSGRRDAVNSLVAKSLEELHELVHVVAPPVTGELIGVAPGQCTDALGQIVSLRHTGALDEHRDEPDVAP
jgi:hypothetical protein